MVRMRDVLRSVRDIKRPGQSGDYNSTHSSEEGGLKFPASSAKHPAADAPSEPHQAEQEGSAREEMEDRQANLEIIEVTPTEKQPEKREKPTSPYHIAIEAVNELLDHVSSDIPFDLEAVEGQATIFAEMLSKSDQLFMHALSAKKMMSSLAQHAVSVSIIAIKVAFGMGYSREKVIEVGLCGMVHEVGMTRVPPDILDKRGELSQTEYEQIKQHPIHGRKILETVRDEYPFLPDVIAQEHERWNGNGYPFGLKGEEIHEYAQIIGMADTFVALTHVRHYRDNFIAYKAIQSIIERRNIDFSARLIKALIDVISIFPVHSLVKLNNGSIARVIQTNKQFPVRPVIEVIVDSNNNKLLQPQQVDLSQEPMIYIVSPVLDESAYM